MTAPLFFPAVTIIGVGLIGGSIAKVMKAKNLAGAITGAGRSREALDQALQLGVIDRLDFDTRHSVEKSDLVVLATPVRTFEPIVRAIGSHIKSGAILTDVGSVKGGMVGVLEDLLPPSVHFVPGHPIAGRERHGVAAATESLFQGAKCILTPTVRTDARALETVKSLWAVAGASVIVMDPDMHDHDFAAVSHLPHVAAFAMMNAVAELGSGSEKYLHLSGAGFRDFTRIAASSPEMWRDICLDNRAEILAALDDFLAQATPEAKLELIREYQAGGRMVAMTGDGVNDAPALRKADIGVAMGEIGTDAARGAADMVLTDDNFATIVAAVEEGRVIYDNVRKFIRYILASNVGEILVMFLGPVLGMPLPLLPLQILWVNLLTDGLPALALGVEPPEADLMRRPPRPPEESVLGRGTWGYILGIGAVLGVLCLAVALPLYRAGDPAWRTALFTTLTLAQMAHVLAIRSEKEILRRRPVPANRPLLGAVALTVLLQMAVVYLPPLQDIFRTAPLSAPTAGLCVAASAGVFLAAEAGKYFRRLADGRAGE